MPDQKPSTLTAPGKKAATWVAICIACVGGFEGLKTVAYKDPVGIPTICFGETRGVKMGDTATVEACKGMLAERVVEFDTKLQSSACIGKEQMDALPPQTRAAVVSLIYNTGPGKQGVKDGVCELKGKRDPNTGHYPPARASTLAVHLRYGRIEEACAEFPKWANPPLPGLVKRRAEEQRMCLEGLKELESQP